MLLNHLNIRCANPKEVVDFYIKYFGFTISSQGNLNTHLISKEGSWLTIGSLGENDLPMKAPEWFHYGYVTPIKEQPEYLFHRMKADGVPFGRELTKWENAITFYCFDPAGNKVEMSWIYEYEQAWKASQGRG